MDWQPISTAPKRKLVMVWERGAKKPRLAINYADAEGDYWQATDETGRGCTDQIFPACWFPLPKKPDLRRFRDAPYAPPVDNRPEWQRHKPSPWSVEQWAEFDRQKKLKQGSA